jgi:predicted dehydrogenase/threonine dehydrogenase-like Zn-dependent dehydrogenase
MKQILQSFKTGITSLEEVPAPRVSSGCVLIKTTYSLVSLGTERMLVEFGKSNLISKARKQPEKVRMVMDKIKAEGLLPTIETIYSKLQQPLPLGYCNVGQVIAIGDGVTEFTIGDRVSSNGQHAEYVNLPKNLVAKIPNNVTDEEASFTVIGSIGLQGIRLCKPNYGETIVVFGLGLIGLLTAQMLVANGCRVIGIDIDDNKCLLAEQWGVNTINPSLGDTVKQVLSITNEIGADAVIITASAKNNDIISQSAQMSRMRGRVILVGVVGLDINRADFYEKELSFQVSCSYGPGRYDEQYEQGGVDYPLGFVRWTEKRNFEAVLHALGSGQLHVKDLISEVVELEKYHEIYDKIGTSDSIASILKYPLSTHGDAIERTIKLNDGHFLASKAVLGIIGAGNFTKMTLLPNLFKTGAGLKYIASSAGVTGTALAKKYQISNSTSDYHEILRDSSVDTVIITTRHNLHAKMVTESLEAGKHVFVEKPLALSQTELDSIISSYESKSVRQKQLSLTVGYNRRFSPHVFAIKQALGKSPTPLNIITTMNAGFIPQSVWVQDLKIGGGRIVGEACHYIDLCVYLTGSKVQSVCMNALGDSPKENTDNASLLLRFENGSNATINYFSNGAKSYSKERIEVFNEERVYIIDNFRSTKAFGDKHFKNIKTKIDKGHKTQFAKLVKRITTGGSAIIPIDEIINSTLASFAALKSLKEKQWVSVESIKTI